MKKVCIIIIALLLILWIFNSGKSEKITPEFKTEMTTKLEKTYQELQETMQKLPEVTNCPAEDIECTGFLNFSRNKNINSEQARLFARAMNTNNICDGSPKKCFGEDYTIKSTIPELTERLDTESAIITEDNRYISFLTYDIIVDLNGSKKPNTIGRDIFYFTYPISSQKSYIMPNSTIIPYGSKLNAQYTQSQENYWNYYPQKPFCSEKLLLPHCTGRVLEEKAMNY